MSSLNEPEIPNDAPYDTVKGGKYSVLLEQERNSLKSKFW